MPIVAYANTTQTFLLLDEFCQYCFFLSGCHLKNMFLRW